LDEKNFVLEKIKELSFSKKIDYKQIAIIVRSNREVEDWSNFLQENSILVESKLKTNILKSDYIKFILKYLEIIENPYSSEDSFIDILRSEFVSVDKLDIIAINKFLYNKNYTRKDKIKIFDILSKLENFEEIDFRSKQKIIDFRDNLLFLNSRLSTSNFIIFFNEFIEKT
jgi:ATP-dependent exoDNAse (exonuclease V) beta subunit